MAAPGRHGATRSRSSSAVHTRSSGAWTSKVCSIFIAVPAPLGCRCPPGRRDGRPPPCARGRPRAGPGSRCRRAALLGGVAEHDDARLDTGDGGERVLEQRPAAELCELLRAAEPPALAGREHERPDRHTPTSWIRPWAPARRPPVRPWRIATI